MEIYEWQMFGFRIDWIDWRYVENVRNCVGKYLIEQDAQLSQRDRAAGCVIVFAKSRTLELGDNILRTL